MVCREDLTEEVIFQLRTQRCQEPRGKHSTETPQPVQRSKPGKAQVREERKPGSGPGAKQVRRRKVHDTDLICYDGQVVINLSSAWDCEKLFNKE